MVLDSRKLWCIYTKSLNLSFYNSHPVVPDSLNKPIISYLILSHFISTYLIFRKLSTSPSITLRSNIISSYLNISNFRKLGTSPSIILRPGVFLRTMKFRSLHSCVSKDIILWGYARVIYIIYLYRSNVMKNHTNYYSF